MQRFPLGHLYSETKGQCEGQAGALGPASGLAQGWGQSKGQSCCQRAMCLLPWHEPLIPITSSRLLALTLHRLAVGLVPGRLLPSLWVTSGQHRHGVNKAT